MNREGTLASTPDAKCAVRQNARGDLFFVVKDGELYNGLTRLLDGDTALTK